MTQIRRVAARYLVWRGEEILPTAVISLPILVEPTCMPPIKISDGRLTQLVGYG